MHLIETSMISSAMIILVLMIRKLGKEYIPKTIISFCWDLILLRALFMVRIPINNIPIVQETYQKIQLPKLHTEFAALTRNTEGMQKIKITGKLFEKSGNFFGGWQIRDYGILIWITGVALLSVYFTAIYCRELVQLNKSRRIQNEIVERMIKKRSLKRRIRIYEGSFLTSPVTYGIVSPKIVLPENEEDISRVDMRNMIAHELVHIQRFDVAKRFVMSLVLCIHWFNPFIWVMYFFYREDQEMSCDACVLKEMGEEETQNYVYTMIKMSSEKKGLLSTTGFAGKNFVKKRIVEAMGVKKMGKAAYAVIILIGLCTMASAITIKSSATMEEIEIKKERVSTEKSATEQQMAEADMLLQVSPEFQETYMGFTPDPDFNYKEVMQDIIENYNDFTQPLTEEQEIAIRIKECIYLADTYQKWKEEGRELTAYQLWMIDEFYDYETKHS